MKVTRVIVGLNTCRWNARHGIGRLGDVGDVDNLVHDNLLVANGEAGVHVGWQNSVPAGWERATANFVVGNRCFDNARAGVLLEYATGNAIARNAFRGKAVVEGREAGGNWVGAGDGEALPVGVPAERLKLFDELLLRRDAQNMREWAVFKKGLRVPEMK